MEEDGGDAASSATAGNNEPEHAGADNINIKVSFGANNFDVVTTPQSTFGDLKRVIAKETGLDPKVQNVLFRGKEIDDHETLQMAGVKDNSKVILIENTATINEDIENVEEIKENIEEVSRGLEAVNRVREENNQFEEQVPFLCGDYLMLKQSTQEQTDMNELRTRIKPNFT